MIPQSPAEVTAAWLTAVLGVEVVEAVVGPIGTGQTGATYRVTVTYASTTDLPRTFVVKLPSQEAVVRERVALSYRAEHAFYTQVASTVDVPVPTCYHCDIANDGGDFVLLLADQAPAVQGDQIAGCSVAEARLAVTAMAGLHGPRWCDPAWTTFPGAVMGKPDEAAAGGLGEIGRLAATQTLEKLGPRLTAGERATLAAASSAVAPWLMLEPDRFCLLHGDFRLDNLLFDPQATRVTVVDWQTLTIGLPSRDLAYFVATSLVRRAEAERELVAAYHEALVGCGVGAYDLETCWRDYRLGMLQVPLLTMLGWAFSAATDRGDEMTLTMLRRGCRAIDELGTLDLIRELS